MNSCQLIPTHYIDDKHKIKTSWADERIEEEGYGMNNEWHTGRHKVPRGQSSREKVEKQEARAAVQANRRLMRLCKNL